MRALSHDRIFVSLLSKGEPLPNTDGNLFELADTVTKEALTKVDPNLKPTRLQWTGPRELLITYDARARVITMVMSNTILVKYRAY